MRRLNFVLGPSFTKDTGPVWVRRSQYTLLLLSSSSFHLPNCDFGALSTHYYLHHYLLTCNIRHRWENDTAIIATGNSISPQLHHWLLAVEGTVMDVLELGCALTLAPAVIGCTSRPTRTFSASLISSSITFCSPVETFRVSPQR